MAGYMDRALKAKDPRFARILGKLGYERRDMVAAEPVADDDDLAALRAEYQVGGQEGLSRLGCRNPAREDHGSQRSRKWIS